MKTIQRNRTTDTAGRYVSFDATDRKGREIGTKVYLFEVDYIEDAEAHVYYTHPTGHYFAFVPHATRDQHHYGALQSTRTFCTADERDKAIEHYLAAAKKRAGKIA